MLLDLLWPNETFYHSYNNTNKVNDCWKDEKAGQLANLFRHDSWLLVAATSLTAALNSLLLVPGVTLPGKAEERRTPPDWAAPRVWPLPHTGTSFHSQCVHSRHRLKDELFTNIFLGLNGALAAAEGGRCQAAQTPPMPIAASTPPNPAGVAASAERPLEVAPVVVEVVESRVIWKATQIFRGHWGKTRCRQRAEQQQWQLQRSQY